jgi:type I restriction enzyme, S subunit
MVNGEQQLPDGWKLVTGKDLFTWSSGKGLTQAELQDGNIPVYGGNGINGYHNMALIAKPTLLVGRVGALCGNVHITSGSAWITDNAIYARTISNEIDLRFAKLVFSEANLNQKAAGSGQPFVNQRMLNEVQIPLPALPEQKRIVAKVDELVSQVEAGTSALAKVQAGLRRYNSSMLETAIKGKLVKQDSADIPAEKLLKDMEESTLFDNSNLPNGWCWTNLSQLKKFSLYGPRFSSKEYVEEGIPMLRTTDMTEWGKIHHENAPKIALSEQEYQKYKCERGDLLITRTGSIGTLAVFNDDIRAFPGAFLIQYRLRVPELTAWYIFYYLKSPTGFMHMKNRSAGIGRANLNAPSIDEIPIPLPPLEEQRRIVAEFERRLSVARQVENSVEAALVRAARLRQAVLRSAFEGRLV